MRDRAPWQIDGAAIVRAALQGDPDARAAVEEIVLAVFKREWAARKERQEKITGAEAARRLEVPPRTWARRSRLPELAAYKTDDGRWLWPELEAAYQRLFG